MLRDLIAHSVNLGLLLPMGNVGCQQISSYPQIMHSLTINYPSPKTLLTVN